MITPTATASYNKQTHTVNITWTSFADIMPMVGGIKSSVVQFIIYRKEVSDSSYTQLDYSLPPESLSYTDSPILQETHYTYLIVALDKYLNTKTLSVVVDTNSRTAGYSFIEHTMQKLPRWTAAWPKYESYQETLDTIPATGLSTYNLMGSVVDLYSSAAITGASVVANAKEYTFSSSTTTNATGGFILELPAPTTYSLQVSLSEEIDGRSYYTYTLPSVYMTTGDQLLDPIGLSSSATGIAESVPVSAALQVRSNDSMYQSQLYSADASGAMPTIALSGIVWEVAADSITLLGASGTTVQISTSGTTYTLTEHAATGSLMTFIKSPLPEIPPTYRTSSAEVTAGDNIYVWTDGAWVDTGEQVTSIASTSTTGATINGITLAVTGMLEEMLGFQTIASPPTSGGYTRMSPSTGTRDNLWDIQVGDYLGNPGGGIPNEDETSYYGWMTLGGGLVVTEIVAYSAAASALLVNHTTGSSIIDKNWGKHYYAAWDPSHLTPLTLFSGQTFTSPASALAYYNYLITGVVGDTTIYGYARDNYRLRAFTTKGIKDPNITIPVSGDAYVSPLSSDALLRRVLTAECMPIGTAYDLALQSTENLSVTTALLDVDSVIWQASYTPKPSQKLTVSYGGITLRQATDIADFVQTTDASWYVTAYDAKRGMFDEQNPTKLVYLRNLDLEEVEGIIDGTRNLQVCSASDFHEDSTVWVQIPDEIRERVPEYFRWRKSESISTSGSYIYASIDLPAFISVAKARYRSNTLRDLAVNTPYITINDLSVSMRPIYINNALDELGEIAGVQRHSNETNTELMSRIIREAHVSVLDAERLLLFKTANDLGYLDLVWWNTEEDPLLLLEDNIIDVFIPGLPETASVNELLTPESSGSSTYLLSNKKQPVLPYNISSSFLSFTSSELTTGGLVDLGRHFSTDVYIQYSYLNYEKIVVDGHITQLDAVAANAAPGIYPVLCLREICADTPTASTLNQLLNFIRGKGSWGQKHWLAGETSTLTYTDSNIL